MPPADMFTRHLFADYGHMDLLVGKTAHHDVFPYLKQKLSERSYVFQDLKTAQTAPTPHDLERRWAVVFMADMVGYGVLIDRIGGERAFFLTKLVMEAARNSVEANNGYTVGTEGDSILATFGAPIAIEEATSAAVQAAVMFQEHLAGMADGLRQDYGVAPDFRVSLSDGPILIDRSKSSDQRELQVLGRPVNLCARMQSVAAQGDILVTESIANQLGGKNICSYRGAHAFKSFAHAINVYAVRSKNPYVSRFQLNQQRGLVDIVERDTEVQVLKNFIEEPATVWNAIFIEAQAGGGKSRLVYETTQRIDPSINILTGQCQSHKSTLPYHPFLQILRQVAKADDYLPAPKLMSRLENLFGPLSGREALLYLMGAKTNPAIQALRPSELHNAFLDLLCRLGKQRRYVLLIEDTHWIDRSSLNVITSLLDTPDTDGFCKLVITTREVHKSLLTGDYPISRLSLSALSRDGLASFAQTLLRGKTPSADLVDTLYFKTQGNPLFTEEILRHLSNAEAFVEENSELRLSPTDESDLLTGNIHQLFMRQVDRLTEREQLVLRCATILGNPFDETQLLEMLPIVHKCDDRHSARDVLERLRGIGLLNKNELHSDRNWSFTHELLKDAVYWSMLDSNRAKYHDAAACMMIDSEFDKDNYLVIAHHLQNAERVAEAIPYLLCGARDALAIYALRDVDAIFCRVADLITDTPELISDQMLASMMTDWLEAMQYIGNFTRSVEIIHQFLPRLEARNDPALLTPIMAQYASALTHMGDYTRAYEIALAGAQDAAARNDQVGVVWMHLPLLRYYQETATLSFDEFEIEADKMHQKAHDLGLMRLAELFIYLKAAHLRSVGDVVAARQENERLMQYAIAHGDPRAAGFSGWSNAILQSAAMEYDEALQTIENARQHVLNGTADAYILDMVHMSIALAGSCFERMATKLQRTRNLAERYGDMNTLYPLELLSSLSLMRQGKLCAGWKNLQTVNAKFIARGHVSQTYFSYLTTIELLLMICGNLPPTRPHASHAAQPIKMSLADKLMGLNLKLTARWRARKLLREFWSIYVYPHTGAHIVRALICDAVLSKGSSRQEKFAKARHLAAKQHLKFLIDRIDTLVRK